MSGGEAPIGRKEGELMSNHDHTQCEHEHQELMTRRKAFRHSLNLLLAGTATTLAFMLPSGQARAGYGHCEFNGCPCLGFSGNGENCVNCGHLFTYHAN
jgi:hypothetical protein